MNKTNFVVTNMFYEEDAKGMRKLYYNSIYRKELYWQNLND